MSDVTRTALAIDRGLLEKFDAWMTDRGYTNRSEAVRDLMRSALIEAEWADPGDIRIGQWAVALGLGFGGDEASITVGIVSALGRMRGEVQEYAGYPVVVTYHPAALLRNPAWIRPTWEDLQIVRRLLDGEAPLG